jgi:hypothetical protein
MVTTDQHTYIGSNTAIKTDLKVFTYTDKPVTLNFKSSQRHDFTICNSKGDKVWQWSDGQQFLPLIGELVLKPNDTVTYSALYQPKQMNQDLYTVKGDLTAYDFRLRKPCAMTGTVSFWRVLVR